MKLTNTVTNITKNNKGFSLLEVLVGVSIIGIISAIAVPTYQNYSKNASKVAAETTTKNAKKAHLNCLVLNSFAGCDSLAEISLDCSDCGEGTNGTDTFCIDIEKAVPGGTFKACVSMTGNTTTTTFGGTLTDKVCHAALGDVSGQSCGSSEVGSTTVCADATSCTSAAYTNPDSAKCTVGTNSCKVPSTAGDCNASAGTCS